MLDEFKKFALRGNLVDTAIGIVLGLAFNAVVQSLVNDVLLNAVAGIFGEPDFSELAVGLGDGVIRYGAFLTTVVNFVLVALSLFFVVRVMNRIAGKREEAPTNRECPYCKTSIPLSATRCSSCTSEVEAAAA